MYVAMIAESRVVRVTVTECMTAEEMEWAFNCLFFAITHTHSISTNMQSNPIFPVSLTHLDSAECFIVLFERQIVSEDSVYAKRKTDYLYAVGSLSNVKVVINSGDLQLKVCALLIEKE